MEAQKIKYKDLFPLLDAKNYQEGGPQLIQYLSDPKNQEEANPNLQMGLMLEHRFLTYDVVFDSAKLYDAGDSAVTYLERAKTLIDEKELKKRDEYYQSFFRRDLRTGEFGIKVSDVHLDIEKKIEAINERIANVRAMHQKIRQIESNHQAAIDGYKALTQKYDSYNALLLSADESDKAALLDIEQKGRTANDAAKEVKEIASNLGSEKYQSDIDFKEIVQFGKDGLEAFNVRSGSITLWDFETWGREAQSEIRGGVGLFKTMISNFFKEIREKKAKVKNSENVEIASFPKDIAELFQKYAPGSVVEKLLRAEMHEAQVIKHVDLQINPSLMDSSLVGSQLQIYTIAKAHVDTLNLLVESIIADDLEAAKKMFPDYMDSFFKQYVTASKYVEEMVTWSRRNKEWIGKSVEYWTDRNRWGIVTNKKNEERKLPLFENEMAENGFKTMGVLVASIPEYLVYGADMTEKKGYVASFGPDRIEKWKLDFDLPGTDNADYVYDTIPSASGSVNAYVFNKNATKDNLSLVSFTLAGQLNWAVRVSVSKEPVDYKFDDLTQELTILLYPEEELPLDSDELGYVVIDRTGNAR